MTTRMDDWKQSILACHKCGSRLTGQADKQVCPACGVVLLWEDGILISPRIQKDSAYTYYANEGGTTIRERAKHKLTTSSLEDVTYSSHLKNYFELPKDDVVMDLGCGDGRMTFHLLEMGYTRIVAVDQSLESLQRIQADLPEEELGKVFLINSDLLNIPIIEEGIAGVVAIEVLYYLQEKFDQGLKTLHHVMKSGAILLNSEPTVEGALLYFLMNQDYDSMKIVAEQKMKTERGHSGNSILSRVFARGEMEKILEHCGFMLQHIDGVPVYGNLGSLVINANDKVINAEEREKWSMLLTEFMKMAAPPYRCECYIRRKTE